MSEEKSNQIAEAISQALDFTYDQVRVSRDNVLRAMPHYELPIHSWEEYQAKAPLRCMDEIADAHVKWCKIHVSGASTALGVGGAALAIPDVLQFTALTLRMVTGIAAAYGFDPDPEFLQGKTQAIILQAYLNGSIGARTTDVAERLSLSAATRYVAVASMRKDPILKLIVQIGKVLGNRVTRKMILNALPVVSAGVSGGLSWGWANQMGRSAKREFRAFREDLRQGKYLGDPDFDGLVGQECHYDVEQRV